MPYARRLRSVLAHLAVGVGLLALTVPAQALFPVPCVMPGCDDGVPPETRLARTFQPGVPSSAAWSLGRTTGVASLASPVSPVLLRATTPDDFSLGRDDFFDLFVIGHEVHVGVSAPGAVYEMDIGARDLDVPQTWTLPDIPYADVIVYTIHDPATTVFPTWRGATHALVTTNHPLMEGTVTLYYGVKETEIYALGAAWEQPGTTEPIYFPFEYVATPLPMDREIAATGEQEGEDNGVTYVASFDSRMHGYGTVDLPDGTSRETGAFVIETLYRDPAEPDPDEILGFDVLYSIFAEDATWFSFFIADPPGGGEVPVEGDVYLQDVEFWQIVDPNAVAAEDGPATEPAWAVYPNPTADVVRFVAPTTVTVYDVQGRRVRSGERVRSLAVGDLAPGPYFLRADDGRRATLVVR